MSGFDSPEGLSPFVSFTTLNWIRLMLRPASRLNPKGPLSPGFSYRCRSGFRVNWQLPWQIPFNLLELLVKRTITQRFVALQEFRSIVGFQ
jgi:hypothetical protein